MNDIEKKYVKYIHDFGKGKIDFLTAFVSSLKMLAILWSAVLLISFAYFPGERALLLQRIAVVTFLHFAISEGLFKYLLPKFMGARQRPFVAYPDEIKPIGHQFSDGSMPSSHIASTVAMVVVLFSIFPIVLIPGIGFSLLMGFSRIHNGMHYPSDVIMGAVLGAAYGLVSIFIL